VGAIVLALVAAADAQTAKKKTPSRPLKPRAAAVPAEKTDLFAGMEANRLAVRFIPRDEKIAHVAIANLGKVPLEVAMPNYFAGAPVLSKAAMTSDGRYNFGTLVSSTPPQTLGSVYPTPIEPAASATHRHSSSGNGKAGKPTAASLTIAPGRMVQFMVPCVCLQYGNPTPRPEIPYRLVKLDTFSKKPELAALLDEFSHGRLDQPLVQLVAWHFSNDLSFEELAETGFASDRLGDALQLATYIRGEVGERPDGTTPDATSPGIDAASPGTTNQPARFE
jgi:hypothetical protein